MNHETTLVAQYLFWIFLVGTVVLPVRWSVIAYLLLVQFDLSGIGNYSIGSLGFENAIKVVVVPTLLLIRVRPIESLAPRFRRLSYLWLLLTAYAAVAIVWSPYRLSAMKMLGYFYAYSALFVVFVAAWRRQWFRATSLAFVIWLSLIIASIQTYILSNEYGNPEFEFRFTTFVSPQSFAAFLLSLLVLLLFSEEWSPLVLFTTLGASIGLVLTGSRSIFLGFIWIVLVGGVVLTTRSGRKLNYRLIVKRCALSVAGILCVGALVLNFLPENRLNEMLAAAVSPDVALEDVGTFAWRFVLYQKTVDELANRKLLMLLTGSGTSSGANVILENGIFKEDIVDPNRSLHDEFLRSIYEWGLFGLLFFLLFLAELINVGVRMATQNRSREAWAFLAICVPLLISLTVENVLADSASPGGIGYSLVLTSMVAAGCVHVEKKRSRGFNTNSEITFHPEGSAVGMSGS
jgi:hypothetical protein